MINYKTLGRSGIKVSTLGVGTANFGAGTDDHEASRIINYAVDIGINLIDTADSYANGESEKILGAIIKENGLREKIVLASKVHFPMGESPNQRGNSRVHILRAVENSLKRLQTDVIDIYLLHRPDFLTPQEETLRTMDDLISQGKIRYFGTSTFPAWMIMEGIAVSEKYRFAKPIVEQAPYNLVDRRIENEVLPLCLRHNLGVIVWSPLAGGVLAGKYPLDVPLEQHSFTKNRDFEYFRERITVRSREMAVRIDDIAKEIRLTVAQLALIWVKDRPGVSSVLLGPRKLDHLVHATPILEQTLEPEILNRIDSLIPPGSAVANFYNTSNWMREKIM
jgi:aryl-alcohol dehydrogenase-like predicted oxidoreductase